MPVCSAGHEHDSREKYGADSLDGIHSGKAFRYPHRQHGRFGSCAHFIKFRQGDAVINTNSYKKAGVDIEAGAELVERIKPLAGSTDRSGVMGGLGPHVYTMAKHGVVGLTKSAASELSPHRVRVNAVAPGGTVTAMTAALAGNNSEAITEAIAATSPLGRAAVAGDMANAILFALSDDASYMTGHTLVIDAGETTANTVADFHVAPSEIMHHAGQRSADTGN